MKQKLKKSKRSRKYKDDCRIKSVHNQGICSGEHEPQEASGMNRNNFNHMLVSH